MSEAMGALPQLLCRTVRLADPMALSSSSGFGLLLLMLSGSMTDMDLKEPKSRGPRRSKKGFVAGSDAQKIPMYSSRALRAITRCDRQVMSPSAASCDSQVK